MPSNPADSTRGRIVSVCGRLCCKSLKTPGDKFPARSRNKPRSLIDVASGSLPKSPVSLSPGDEVPHMFTRKPRLQLEKFAINGAKRLLQHNLPGTDIPRVSLRRGAKKHRIDIWFHTALMPANLITPAHFSVSSAINLLKSAGEPRNAVLPRSHVGVAEGGVDLPVELVDDLDGRISGCADAVPGCVGRARSCRARSGAPHLPAPAERPRPRPHPPLGSRETPP